MSGKTWLVVFAAIAAALWLMGYHSPSAVITAAQTWIQNQILSSATGGLL